MFTTFATCRVFGRQQIGASNSVYPFPNRNYQGPDGAVHAGRARNVLVCRWQQSSVTGKLECAWGTEHIAAASLEGGAPSAPIVPLRWPVSVTRPSQGRNETRVRALHRIAEWLPHWLRGVPEKSPSLFDLDRGARAALGSIVNFDRAAPGAR